MKENAAQVDMPEVYQKKQLDPLDPANYTKVSLEKMRQSMETRNYVKPAIKSSSSQDPSPQSEFTKNYWRKTTAPVIFKKAELKEVRRVFRYYINQYEIENGAEWRSKDISFQLNTTVEHLTRFINGETYKTLFLYGKSGMGKSRIFKSFYFQTYNAFKRGNLISKIHASDILLKQTDLLGSALNHCWIDDLGLEVNYVKPISSNWMPPKDEIIHTVNYLFEKRRESGKLTHITSNLDLPELMQIYGARNQWRFDEMFEFIKF